MRKAALRASGAIDEPNLVLPLASSFNERGIAGFTHSVTNSEDQRKVNCYYELVKNALTGKGTLTLSKRPGVTIDSNSWGTNTQNVYLITKGPNVAPWIIVKISNDIKAATTSGPSFVIVNA